MTFEQLIATVREWRSTMTPEQVRAATEELAGRTTIGVGNLIVGGLDADALWVYAASSKPAEHADAYPVAFVRKAAPPPSKPKRRTKAVRAPAPPPVIDADPLAPAAAASQPEPPPKPARRGKTRAAERARKLVREQLKHGRRPESSVLAAAEAAEIPEHTLIAAASVLGVRTQRGQWWLPG